MHGRVKKLAYDAHLVMPYNSPYLIGQGCYSSLYKQTIASELNALTAAQVTPWLVVLSHA